MHPETGDAIWARIQVYVGTTVTFAMGFGLVVLGVTWLVDGQGPGGPALLLGLALLGLFAFALRRAWLEERARRRRAELHEAERSFE